MKRRSKYGFVSASRPEAAGRCDRGGEIRKRSELFKQMAWRGDRLAWTGLWVCKHHRDAPQGQDRAKRLRADPIPVRFPLPDIDARVARAQVGDPIRVVENDVGRATEVGDARATEDSGALAPPGVGLPP